MDKPYWRSFTPGINPGSPIHRIIFKHPHPAPKGMGFVVWMDEQSGAAFAQQHILGPDFEGTRDAALQQLHITNPKSHTEIREWIRQNVAAYPLRFADAILLGDFPKGNLWDNYIAIARQARLVPPGLKP